MASSESISRLLVLFVAIIAVGLLLLPSSKSPDADILDMHNGMRKRTRRSPLPHSMAHTTRHPLHSTITAPATSAASHALLPGVEATRLPEPREVRSPSSSPLIMARRIPTSSPTVRHIRVSWIGRTMNFFSRVDPIVLLLENVTGVRATLEAPDGGPFSHDDTDVFLVQAIYPTDVRTVHQRHKSHALFLFVATEQIYKTDNLLDVADVSFGQAPWQHTPGAACNDANNAPNFIRTPVALLRAIECSWNFPVLCGVKPRLRIGAAVGSEAWAARPGLALHVARHGGFPRELLVDEFRTLGKRLDRAGPARNRTVDCPGSGVPGCPNMAWPGDLPRFTLQGKLDLTSRYRFSIQPENSRTACLGYMTEKVYEGM